MKIWIVIPVHNENAQIGPLLEAIRRQELDVVVIDDGSSDASGQTALEKGAVVLTNPVKQGKGRSLQRGFQYALEQAAEGVITMDGDGQHDPEDLKGFLAAIQANPERIIAGNRMEQCSNMPFLRRQTNRFMSWLISVMCRRRIPDTQCGYRYICSSFLKRARLSAGDFEIETEVLVKAAKLGFPIDSVPVKTIYQNEQSKINPLKDTLRFLAYLWKETFSR